MLFSLLLTTAAWADCPDALTSIKSAESDAVQYFLSDANASLAETTRAFSCSEIPPETLTRYFLARAMVWSLQEDPRVDTALAAARNLRPEQFTDELGKDLRAAWSAITPETLAPTIPVKVRGTKSSDKVLIDGTPSKSLATTSGLHLVQVQRGSSIVYGRVVDAQPGEALELILSDKAQSAPSTEVQGPIVWKRGPVDATGRKLHMFRDIAPLALLSEEGKDAFANRNRNTALQGAALGLTGAGLYTTYLFTWDATAGHNTTRDASKEALIGALAGGGAVAIGGIVWEIVLLKNRKKIRERYLNAANTALGHAP